MSSTAQQVHETVIKDIVDVLHDLKDSDEIQMLANKNSGKSIRSIAKSSSNLILTFPVLCVNTLGIESAGMITKAIERKCVMMLQLLFNALSISEKGDDVFEYLKTFHTNMGKVTIDDYIDTMEKITAESGELSSSEVREVLEMFKEDMKNLNFTLKDSIEESSLSKFLIASQNSKFPYMVTVQEDLKEMRDRAAITKDTTGAIKDMNELFHKSLIDGDVKKANELQPSMMVVKVFSGRVGEKETIIQQFVVGVKAKLIPMDSFDVIQRIQVKNDDHKGMLKFLRATTREISFFKDFVFAIDRAKLDAMAYSKNSTYASIWKMLERRSIKGGIRNGFQMKNDATRIATLVISQEEVEYLKKSGVDIDTGNVARVTIEAYGLLSFVIVNESLEVARFLFDDDSNVFEDVSFRNLERESGDKDYRKIVNLMSKMR